MRFDVRASPPPPVLEMQSLFCGSFLDRGPRSYPKTKMTLSFHSCRDRACYVALIKTKSLHTKSKDPTAASDQQLSYTMKLLPIAFAVLLSFSSSQVLGSSNGNSSYDNESLEDSYKRLKNEGCRNCPGGERDRGSAATTCPPGAGANNANENAIAWGAAELLWLMTKVLHRPVMI